MKIFPLCFRYLKFTILSCGISNLLFSYQLPIKAEKISPDFNQSKDFSTNLSPKLFSPWENAALTNTLEPATTINILKFSPDGEILAGVGTNQITLWQVETGETSHVLPGHYTTETEMEIAPISISFSPDSRWLATATWSQGLLSPDNSIIVRDATTGETALNIAETDGCRQVLFDTTGKVIYGACSLGVTAWSFPEGEKLFTLNSQSAVEAIALSPDSKILATANASVSGDNSRETSNQIQLWQLDQDQPSLINNLDGHSNNIAKLEFTDDGKNLISSSYDGKINVWNLQTGQVAKRTNNLHSKNGLFSLNNDQKLIAGNFHSSSMTSLTTGLPLRNTMMIPRQGQTNTIAFDDQGKVFAWAGSTQTGQAAVNLWEINSNQSQIPSSTVEYLPLDLTQYWGDYEQPGGEITVELNTTNPEPIGKNPQEIALAALGLGETIESEQETVALAYPTENLATVEITQTNLVDDSVADISYLVKFAPYGDRTEEQWRVIWAGQKFRCQQNRGHQDWGTDLCN